MPRVYNGLLFTWLPLKGNIMKELIAIVLAFLASFAIMFGVVYIEDVYYVKPSLTDCRMVDGREYCKSDSAFYVKSGMWHYRAFGQEKVDFFKSYYEQPLLSFKLISELEEVREGKLCFTVAPDKSGVAVLIKNCNSDSWREGYVIYSYASRAVVVESIVQYTGMKYIE